MFRNDGSDFSTERIHFIQGFEENLECCLVLLRVFSAQRKFSTPDQCLYLLSKEKRSNLIRVKLGQASHDTHP